MTPRDDGVIIFSMIGARSVLPYLVAVKSFHASIGRGRIVILDDGTLTGADRARLSYHLGDPRILAMSDVDTGACPKGGAWERLLTILDLRRDAYVIQLDSDTVTLGPLPEVAAAIDALRSFVLRGEASAELMHVDAFVAQVTPDPNRHVQIAIERVINGTGIRRYARGCAGLAGFAPSTQGRSAATAFSLAAAAIVGPTRWAQWGSEQVASNAIIANCGDPLLLPYDHYLNYGGQPIPDDARFVHFPGSNRFVGAAYIDATDAAIRRLSRS